jgi:chromosomal replication initiator protein
MERSTVYLEAGTRLAADRVRALFKPLLAELLSQDIGTPLQVELQCREPGRFDQLEVSPQRPVIDDSNRTAWLVLKSLGQRTRTGADHGAEAEATSRVLPGHSFFFHGPRGVGKTFLLHWWQEMSGCRPLWFDLPALLKAFQVVHQEHRVEELRAELLQPRPLVLDEIHRIAGKPKLQQFVLAVLRARELLPAVTLMASRWHPQEIRDLDPSLASSLQAGFVAAIGRPGPLGRLRYLRALEGAPSRNGRAAAVETLAQHCDGTFPELRAAWARTRDARLPAKYLELIDPGRVFARLRETVAQRFAVTKDDLLGKGQGRALSRARKVLALLCLQQGLTGGEVGRFLGGRTRAAVSYMARSLQDELAESKELRQQIEDLL